MFLPLLCNTNRITGVRYAMIYENKRTVSGFLETPRTSAAAKKLPKIVGQIVGRDFAIGPALFYRQLIKLEKLYPNKMYHLFHGMQDRGPLRIV